MEQLPDIFPLGWRSSRSGHNHTPSFILSSLRLAAFLLVGQNEIHNRPAPHEAHAVTPLSVVFTTIASLAPTT